MDPEQVEKILARNRADQQVLITEIEEAEKLRLYLHNEEKALAAAADFLAVRLIADKKRLKPRRGRTMGLRPGDVDLTGAETLDEKVRRVAERAPNHEVNITEATDLLLAMKESSETRTQLRAMIHQRLGRSPEYRQIARGWWVLGRAEPNEDDSDDTGSLLSIRAALQVTDRTDSANAEDVDVSEAEEVHEEMEAPEPKPMQWQLGPVDYSDASNLAERLIRLARHTQDGVMDPSQVASRLIEDGQSSQRLASLGRLVRRTMRKHPEFREVHRGWFQWSRTAIPVQTVARVSGLFDAGTANKDCDSSHNTSDAVSYAATIGVRNGNTHK